MPRTWYDYHAISKIENEEKRNLYRSIMAEKKPYFMRYIYPALMNQYNTYIKNTDKNALREFGLTVSELKSRSYDSLSERQIEFLRYYDKCIPVGMNDCVMNQICRKFESAFDNFIKNNSSEDFDFGILKSDAEYTQKEYKSIKSLHEAYVKRLSNFKFYANYERVDDGDSIAGLANINQEFIEECDKICPNSKILCNIMVDICYSKNSTKKFVWSTCGEEIINNLLSNNNNIIRYPVISESGEFEFAGDMFTIETKEIEVSE